MTAASHAGHVPVMQSELVAAVAGDRDGYYVDATYGRGGHARCLLAELSQKARLLVIDRDGDAIASARRLAAADRRVSVAHGRYGDIAGHLDAHKAAAPSGVMFDVGCSSPQFDEAARGFGFSQDGPLDMRMDQRDATTAAMWLNTAAAAEIERVLAEYGEERYARRISRRIVSARPLATTSQLAAHVAAAVPGSDRDDRSATRVFQAIRIRVNDEIGELARGIDSAFDTLAGGGRLAALTFHSLEHRLVRRRFRQWLRGAEAPRRLPVKGGSTPLAERVQGVGSGRRPSPDEVRRNPRARSALLQAVAKRQDADPAESSGVRR